MDKIYSAARIQPEDHRETLAWLWRDNLAHGEVSDEFVAQRMRWFHEQNPAGPARTWMGFHGAEREIIGSGSFYPRDVSVLGRKLKAGILGDFAVTKAHRIAGAAMSIQREIAKAWRAAGVDFLYAFPNRASFPIFQRAGYKKIGEATMWVRPLMAAYKLDELAAASPDEQRGTVSTIVQRAVDFVGAALPSARLRELWGAGRGPQPGDAEARASNQGAGGLDGAPSPARWVSAFAERALLRAAAAPQSVPVQVVARAVDAAMALKDTAAALTRGRRVDAELVDRADGRFDALWARARHRLILGERSAAFLNWRYAEFGGARHRFFCLLDGSDKRLLGYAVYTVRRNKVEIADLFCEDFEGTLDVLMLAFCRAMRREGHVAVGMIYVGAATFGERLLRLGFFQRHLPREVGSRWLIAHVDSSFPEDLRRDVLDVNHWFMTDGELDA